MWPCHIAVSKRQKYAYSRLSSYDYNRRHGYKPEGLLLSIELPITSEQTSEAPPYSVRELGTYFLQLGTVGFGGPVALVGYMHRDLVERRNWISETDYKEGLTLSQLMPGPLAAQL